VSSRHGEKLDAMLLNLRQQLEACPAAAGMDLYGRCGMDWTLVGGSMVLEPGGTATVTSPGGVMTQLPAGAWYAFLNTFSGPTMPWEDRVAIALEPVTIYESHLDAVEGQSRGVPGIVT